MSLADDFSISDPVLILREYNAWRRGGDGPMPDPAVIGRAIDALCDKAERMRDHLGWPGAVSIRSVDDAE